MTNPTDLFLDTLDEEIRERIEESGVPVEHWIAAKGGKEDIRWWQKHGPEMVGRWLQWRESVGNKSGLVYWEIWDWNGTPAIEWDITVELGGSPYRCIIDRVFKAYGPVTDHLFRTRPTELVVVDLKTGTRPPDDDLQLCLNAAAIQVLTGESVKHGGFWMAREGHIDARPLTLDQRACEQIVEQFQRAKDAEVYIPHRTRLCGYCPVNRFCFAYGGAESSTYDSLDPHYQPQPVVDESHASGE